MTLPNNKNLSELHLKCLHTDLFQWVQFCTNYDVELSKEVTQQTYLKIIEGIARYEKLSSLKTWLFGVARITSLELLRDRKVHAIEELDRESEQERDKEPAFVVSIDHFSKRAIASAIDELSLMQREVIYLHFYKDFSLSEISQVLGVTIGTVRTQYHRAKARLNSLLNDWRPECKTN